MPWYVGESDQSGSSHVNITDETTLHIQAGSRFEFSRGSSFNAWNGARIVATGTADAPIVFDSVQSTPGSWLGLSCSEAGKSELEHVEVRWAGDPDSLIVGEPAAVYIYRSSLVMRQSIIHGSASCGVYISNEDQTVNVDDVEYREHNSGEPLVCGDA